MSELRQTKRDERLAEMNERLTDGSLRIRQMTAEERVQHSLAREGRFAGANARARRSSAPQPQR